MLSSSRKETGSTEPGMLYPLTQPARPSLHCSVLAWPPLTMLLQARSLDHPSVPHESRGKVPSTVNTSHYGACVSPLCHTQRGQACQFATVASRTETHVLQMAQQMHVLLTRNNFSGVLGTSTSNC